MEKIKVTLKEIDLLKKRAENEYPCDGMCNMWFEGCCCAEDMNCSKYKAFVKVKKECEPYEEHLREIEGDSHIQSLIRRLNDIDRNNHTIALLERSNLKNQAVVDDILDSFVEIDDGAFDDILPDEKGGM